MLTRMTRMARMLTHMLTRMTRWLAGSHIIHTLSRYQTLVSSLLRRTVFLHRRPKTEFITGQP